MRGNVLKKKKDDDASLFSGDNLVTESDVFFSGMVCDDYNAEAVLPKARDVLCDPNVKEMEETFLCDPNVEEKEETFFCDTMAEKKKETFLYNPNVSSRDGGEKHSVFKLRSEGCLSTNISIAARVLCSGRSPTIPCVC